MIDFLETAAQAVAGSDNCKVGVTASRHTLEVNQPEERFVGCVPCATIVGSTCIRPADRCQRHVMPLLLL